MSLMSTKRNCNDTGLQQSTNPLKRIKLDKLPVTVNVLQFDSASTNTININENYVKYRQHMLSQFVSETTNSNHKLEWKCIEFPGHCGNLSVSPNEKFIVVQYGISEYDRKHNLAFYDLQNNKIAFKLLASEINIKWLSEFRIFPSFYWVNDNYLCVAYNRDYGKPQPTFEICLLDVIKRKCYLLNKTNSGGKIFAINNEQFILVTRKEIECFNVSFHDTTTQSVYNKSQTSKVSIISLKPYRIIPFDFRINNSNLICTYQQCMKLQWIQNNRALIIIPAIAVHSGQCTIDTTVKIYLLDLRTFKLINTKCDFENASFDGSSLNCPKLCFNKMNMYWNWINNDTFYVINDTEHTETCSIYKCNINCIDNKYSMQCTKLPELSKHVCEKTEWRNPYLVIHPLLKENIIIQKYSRRRGISLLDCDSVLSKYDYEIGRWHQCTQINNIKQIKRYKYLTGNQIIVDQLSGLIFVESKFVHESKSECFNGKEIEKPCTYGFDIRNVLNGNKVGFIAIPEIDRIDRPAWEFGLFDNVIMEIGVNCMIMHVERSKYAYLLMNTRSYQYWSDLLYSTSLGNQCRTISDLIATFLCY
eukprot:510866_1